MTDDFTQVPDSNTNDQLGFGLFLAVALHALLIFGVGFSLTDRQPPAPTLEITLAQHKSQQKPEDADYLAQMDQQGSGDQAEKSEITTDRSAEMPAPSTRQAAPVQVATPQQQKTSTDSVITTVADSNLAASHSDQKQEIEGQQAETRLNQPLQELASLQARLDQQRQEYSRMPRVHRLTSASTRSAEEANYMRYWVERIEEIGNSHYPEEARRRQLYGELRLAVTLLPDGTVESVEILQSSGQQVLDQAAVRIVRQAAPFDTFPAELRDWDKLEIIRTWHFERGDTLNTQH